MGCSQWFVNVRLPPKCQPLLSDRLGEQGVLLAVFSLLPQEEIVEVDVYTVSSQLRRLCGVAQGYLGTRKCLSVCACGHTPCLRCSCMGAGLLASALLREIGGPGIAQRLRGEALLLLRDFLPALWWSSLWRGACSLVAAVFGVSFS